MGSTQAERETRRDYCRGCGTTGLQRFTRHATADGHENSCRPRAFYRACSRCGTATLALADVHDAEGLCRATLRDWLATVDTAARVGPTGPPTADGKIDAAEALGWLQERVWQLYMLWDPARCARFTAFATHLLRQGVRQWAQDASGEPTAREHGRRAPKAHAASVSTSLDALLEAAGDADSISAGEHADEYRTHGRDALRRAPLETRRLVLLLYCGYSQVEAAAELGITAARAGAIVKKLRRELTTER